MNLILTILAQPIVSSTPIDAYSLVMLAITQNVPNSYNLKGT